MSAIEFFRESFRSLHSQLDVGLSDLTTEQLHYRPEGKGNHIAFLIWHYVRTEDMVMQGAMQGKPALWVSGEFEKKLGIVAANQGTGMSAVDAAAIRLPSVADFMVYQKRVWEATDAFLASIDDSKLSETRTMGRMGEMPVSRLIGSVVLTHGHTHLGEIQYIRGLQGLKGAAL